VQWRKPAPRRKQDSILAGREISPSGFGGILTVWMQASELKMHSYFKGDPE
jgi:hypothetical protein